MLQEMKAEISFLNPSDAQAGVVVLEEYDFAGETLDWIDPCGPTVWIKAELITDMTDVDFLHWVAGLVGPLAAMLWKPGLSVSPQQAA
jgi:hypothetical protein